MNASTFDDTQNEAKRKTHSLSRGENLDKRFGGDKSVRAGTRKCKRGRCLPMIGRRLSINRAGWMIGGGFDVLSSYH